MPTPSSSSSSPHRRKPSHIYKKWWRLDTPRRCPVTDPNLVILPGFIDLSCAYVVLQSFYYIWVQFKCFWWTERLPFLVYRKWFYKIKIMVVYFLQIIFIYVYTGAIYTYMCCTIYTHDESIANGFFMSENGSVAIRLWWGGCIYWFSFVYDGTKFLCEDTKEFTRYPQTLVKIQF